MARYEKIINNKGFRLLFKMSESIKSVKKKLQINQSYFKIYRSLKKSKRKSYK